jgi:tetratricopeptide (TPR) repeat protein
MIWTYVFMATGLLLGQTQTTLEEKAKAARESNRLDEAVVLYKKAVEQRPDWAEGWWYLGTMLYDQDAYAEAAGALEHAARLNPESAVAFAMLGLSEAKLGRDRDALEHIETGLKLGAGSQADLAPVLQYTKGTLLLAAGKFGDAQQTLDALARKGETQEELIVALGCAVLGIRTVDQSPRGIVRHAGWAEHYAARGEFTDAAREYAALAAEAPKFRDVQFAYGRFLLANHQDDKAVEAFQHEIENTPNHLLARLGIAGIKLKTDPAAGLPYAEQAVKLAPALAEPHYLLGALLLDTGDTDRAIRELEAARKLAPDEAKVYFELSLAYAKVQRKDDAARARAEFTRLDKENPK